MQKNKNKIKIKNKLIVYYKILWEIKFLQVIKKWKILYNLHYPNNKLK